MGEAASGSSLKRKLAALASSEVVAWALVDVVAAFIFYASAKTSADLSSQNGLISWAFFWLKENLSALFGIQIDPSPIGHFCEYFLLGMTLSHALNLRWRNADEPACAAGDACLQRAVERPDREVERTDTSFRSRTALKRAVRVVVCATALAAAYAVSDEVHQLFVPGRVGDISDVVVDSVAACLGALCVRVLSAKAD